ncbi:MAG: hypothetical protein B6241_08115 [Spirochaetaceae bacterium 4572_59]|nr:MAG: hypothetical protein B6241_08115 [Spirochaetaceae bacterium 4572_59]
MNKNQFFYSLFDKWMAKIISILAAILLALMYQINTLQERVISVPLTILTDDNYAVTGDYPQNIRVSLRGSDEQIFSILDDDIRAVADFSTSTAEGSYRSPVQIRFNKQFPVSEDTLEIRVEPEEITIFQEEKIIRSLEITAVFVGFPPNGYELVQYFISPSTIMVQGPRSQMDSIHTVSTEEVVLTNRYDDFSLSTRLVPSGENIYFPGGDIVEIRGVIDESIIVQTLTEQTIITVDLPSGLVISEALPEISLTVQGSQLQLEKLRPRDFHFFLDCANITVPGSYTLPIRADVPPGIVVLKYFPREISVSFEYKREEQN